MKTWLSEPRNLAVAAITVLVAFLGPSFAARLLEVISIVAGAYTPAR